jgi:hypothetical protein
MKNGIIDGIRENAEKEYLVKSGNHKYSGFK